jgi:hypothetical protein
MQIYFFLHIQFPRSFACFTATAVLRLPYVERYPYIGPWLWAVAVLIICEDRSLKWLVATQSAVRQVGVGEQHTRCGDGHIVAPRH